MSSRGREILVSGYLLFVSRCCTLSGAIFVRFLRTLVDRSSLPRHPRTGVSGPCRPPGQSSSGFTDPPSLPQGTLPLVLLSVKPPFRVTPNPYRLFSTGEEFQSPTIRDPTSPPKTRTITPKGPPTTVTPVPLMSPVFHTPFVPHTPCLMWCTSRL